MTDKDNKQSKTQGPHVDLHQQGLSHRRAGHLDEAIANFRAALSEGEERFETIYELGQSLREAGEYVEAAECLARAATLRPNVSQAHHLLGWTWNQLGNLDEAEAAYRRALHIDPAAAHTHNNLGNVFRKRGKLEHAVASYRHAIELDAGFVDALNNLGVALSELGRHDEAIDCYREAIALRPHNVTTLYNLGNANREQMRIDEAIHNFTRAIELEPEHAWAHHNRALLWLMKGDFERGFEEYEWRWRALAGGRQIDCPLWQGEPLDGRTIFVFAEQGYGDILQFVRFLARLKQFGAHVIFECPSRLMHLLRCIDGIDEMVAPDASGPKCDYHIPLMSLPRVLRVAANEDGLGAPYLSADSQRIEKWRGKLSPSNGLQVGLQCQGNPKHYRDSQRSFPLAKLAPLSNVENVHLVVVQQGFGRDQLNGCVFPLFDVGPEIDQDHSFADTAGILANLDLLITCDTALAHLAGAMGVEVWVCLPFVCDWRWLTAGQTSPWYDSVTLFRQRQPGNWDDVFERVQAELTLRVGLNPSQRLRHGREGSLADDQRQQSAGDSEVSADLASGNSDSLVEAAVKLHRRGQIDAAAKQYDEVLRQNPDNVDALHLKGLAEFARGELESALSLISRAIELRSSAELLKMNRGVVLRRMNRWSEAAESYSEVLQNSPTNAQAHFGLGVSLLRLTQREGAIQSLTRASQLAPDSMEALFQLSFALLEDGKLLQAKEVLRRIVAHDSTNTVGHIQLASTLKKCGEPDEARKHFQRAVELDPQNVDALFAYGLFLADARQIDEAVDLYRQVLQLMPTHHMARKNLLHALGMHGRTAEAEAEYDEYLQNNPDPQLMYAASTLMPVVYKSTEEIARYRARTVRHLRTLQEQGTRLEPLHEPMNTLFFLAYQGENDREVHELAGEICKPSSFTATFNTNSRRQQDSRLRVGFISTFLRQHTIGKLWRGVISRLCRERFHVEVFSLNNGRDDAITEFIKQRADRYTVLPGNLQVASDIVAKKELDVLYYTDIGMAPASFALAQSRLAKVQAATWGHPVTTGLPTVDYFVSSQWMEPDGAQDHYSEQLVCLPSIGNYYYRPTQGEVVSREQFGMSKDWHIYLCPQSTFKFHPDFDVAVAQILRGDLRGRFVILKGIHDSWDKLLMSRLRRSMPDVADRICFVPRQQHGRFLSLLCSADVMLDTFHFGGGNTTYEALAYGVPVVTLPSEFLRGRISYGLYRKMGMEDCIATNVDDYVRICLAIGTDGDYRQHVSDKILSTNDTLFEDQNAVTELEDSFERWLK